MILTKEARNLIAQNGAEIQDYILLLRAKLERCGSVPETPISKKYRATTSTPVGESLYDLVDANREAARVLEPLFASVMRSRAAPRGYRHDIMLIDILTSPGCEADWPPKRIQAFEAMCELIAYRLWTREPETRLRVVLSVRSQHQTLADYVSAPSDEPATTKRQARRHDVRESYRRIVAQIEALESEGHTREEAKARMRDALGCGKTRIDDALSWVKAEREDPERANTDWERREAKKGRGAA